MDKIEKRKQWGVWIVVGEIYSSFDQYLLLVIHKEFIVRMITVQRDKDIFRDRFGYEMNDVKKRINIKILTNYR